MTIKPKLLLLLLFLLPFFCRAQQADTSRRNMVKVNLATLIDIFTFPTLQISYERSISQNSSIIVDAGYQIYSQYNKAYTPGFKIAIEYRIYNLFDWIELWGDPENNRMEGLYLGINALYRKSNFDYGIYYYKESSFQTFLDSESNRLDDVFTVDKKVLGSNLLLGYQGSIFKNITLDIVGGLGVINRDIKNTDREFGPDDKLGMHRHDILFQGGKDHLSENSGIRPCVVLGLRLGYKF